MSLTILEMLVIHNKFNSVQDNIELSDDLDASIQAGLRAQIKDIIKYNQQLEQRVGRLELLCGAFLQVFKDQNMATDQLIEILVARLDLEDGVEDGQAGSQALNASCKCPHCQRPANPNREFCVFCLEVLPASMRQQAPKPPPRVETVRCVQCQREVPKRETSFTENGLCCQACYGNV